MTLSVTTISARQIHHARRLSIGMVIGLYLVAIPTLIVSVLTHRSISIEEARYITFLTSNTGLQLLSPAVNDASWPVDSAFNLLIHQSISELFPSYALVLIMRGLSMVSALICVGLLATLATRLFDRSIGISSGLMFATTWGLVSNGWQANDACLLILVYLVMFLFYISACVNPETLNPVTDQSTYINGRSWRVIGFFVFWALFALMAGPLIGMLLPLLGFITHQVLAPGHGVKRFAWLWGWLLVLTAALLPAILLQLHNPEALRIYWLAHMDLIPAMHFTDELTLSMHIIQTKALLLPWGPLAVIGLTVCIYSGFNWKTRKAIQDERLTWVCLFCGLNWVACILLSFILPGMAGKLHLLATLPNAILAALGVTVLLKPLNIFVMNNPVCSVVIPAMGFPLIWVWWRVSDTYQMAHSFQTWVSFILLLWIILSTAALFYRSYRVLLFSFIFCAAGILPLINLLHMPHVIRTQSDVDFAQRVNQTMINAPLVIIKDKTHANHWTMFAKLQTPYAYAPNITYIRADNYADQPAIYVLTTPENESYLKALGQITIIQKSTRSREERNADERLTLYYFEFNVNRESFPTESLTLRQRMGLAPIAYLGDDPREVVRQWLEAEYARQNELQAEQEAQENEANDQGPVMAPTTSVPPGAQP